VSRRTAVVAAALILTTAAPAVAKPVCYKPTEVRAVQFRQLQIELMVAALKCRGVDPSFQDKYAGYVGKVGPALSRNAQELRAMFARQGKGSAALDRFVTDLSNEASIRSLATEDYCEAQDAKFEKLLAMKPHEVEAFAAETMERPNMPANCTPVQQVKAKDKAPSLNPKAKADTKG
jgi:hypothetical protein